MCGPFILNDTDYINKCRVLYSHKYIHGLIFYTKQGNKYSCVANRTNLNHKTHTIDYVDHFLSGFKFIITGIILNAISFQFTSLKSNGTDDCSLLNKYIFVPVLKSWQESESF